MESRNICAFNRGRPIPPTVEIVFSLMTRQGGASGSGSILRRDECRSLGRSKNHTHSVVYEKTDCIKCGLKPLAMTARTCPGLMPGIKVYYAGGWYSHKNSGQFDEMIQFT